MSVDDEPRERAGTDWFGNPLHPSREPVPCPRCGAHFTDGTAFAAHLAERHGERVSTSSGPRRRREDAPALGRRRRSGLSRRLHRFPLVLVLTLNVAVALVALAALEAADAPWWDEVTSQPWGTLVIVPLLWPTILFLALRGLD